MGWITRWGCLELEHSSTKHNQSGYRQTARLDVLPILDLHVGSPTVGHRLFGAQKIMSLRYGRFGSIDSSYILERIVIFTTNCKIEPAVDLPGKAADLYSKVAKDLLGLGTAASPCSTCNEFLMTPNRAMTRSATSFKTHRKRYSRGAKGRLDLERAEPWGNSCSLWMWRLPDLPDLPDPCYSTASQVCTCHLQMGASMSLQRCKVRCDVAAVQKRARKPVKCCKSSARPNLTPIRRFCLHKTRSWLSIAS